MMKSIDEKLKNLLAERETIINEMEELQKAFAARQQRIIEIAGSIKIIQELINEENDKKETSKSDKK
ncbi:MAG: hypothetical protein SPJ27_08835 [Candidatus Onthovivens sp.]|nr:hypothetical protein [Candidatus Onthovivens sp.]